MHITPRPNYSSIDLPTAIERIIQLEDLLGLGFEFHPRYNLTTSEAALLGAIAAGRPICTREHAYTLIYGMHDDPPDSKILDVFLSKLRKKLESHDITISTMWGRGWYMEDADRAKVDAMRFRPAATVESEAA
jgi:hypothetical protein